MRQTLVAKKVRRALSEWWKVAPDQIVDGREVDDRVISFVCEKADLRIITPLSRNTVGELTRRFEGSKDQASIRRVVIRVVAKFRRVSPSRVRGSSLLPMNPRGRLAVMKEIQKELGLTHWFEKGDSRMTLSRLAELLDRSWDCGSC